MADRNPRLVEWEAQYALDGLSMSTPDGILWENRGQAMDAYFDDYSWDWEENLQLLTDVREMAQRYGDYMMIAYAINQNFVADTYYRNPDPLLQDKRGDRDLSRMVTDVAASVHAQANSERKMQNGLQDQFWAGFGLVTTSMATKVDDGDGEEWQQIVVKSLSPWKARFDPRGREWDLSDHKHFTYQIEPSLSQVMAWPWLSEDDRRRIIAWNRAGQRDDSGRLDSYSAQRIDWPLMADNEETDPDIITVPIWMHWDRTKRLVYYRPAGARFALMPRPWDVQFAKKDVFPVVYMAKNREPENKRGTNGFIGIPDMRMIKPHLIAIRRLEALFLEANQHVIFKYLMPKGALIQQAQEKLSSDRQRQILEWDPDALNAFSTEMRDKIMKEGILSLIQQPDLKETRHLLGIKHEFDMIAQILGQASGDRGGMPVTETATDSRIVNERLNQRLSTLRHEAGKHYVALTRLIFLTMKEWQSLPIQYQMTTGYNEKVWAEFSADTLRDLDLHFDFAVGSSEPKTRDQQFALHERFAALMLPILQASGDRRSQMKIARDMGDLLGIRNVDQYFNDAVIDLLKRLATLMYGVQGGQIDPADPRVVAEQIETLMQVLSEMLTESDLADVMATVRNAPAPERQGEGSLPKAPTPGQQEYRNGAGEAAAGALGGMMS